MICAATQRSGLRQLLATSTLAQQLATPSPDSKQPVCFILTFDLPFFFCVCMHALLIDPVALCLLELSCVCLVGGDLLNLLNLRSLSVLISLFGTSNYQTPYWLWLL